MKAIRHVIRGCGYLEHCGHHPGTFFVLAFILIGAIAGSDEGWKGSLGRAILTGVLIGPIYLHGAYERSVEDERLSRVDHANYPMLNGD